MKIALVVPSIAFGGKIETPVVRVLAEQIGSAVELHVFPIFLPLGTRPSRFGDVTVHPAAPGSNRFARRLTRTCSAIRREHLRSPFDFVHAIWLHEPGTIAIVAGSFLRLPVVASVGGAEVVALPEIEYGALRSSRGRFMTAFVLQRATLVTAGSNYALRLAQRVVPHRDGDRFRRAPLPVSAAAFAPSGGRHPDTTASRAVHVGSLIPVKDQPTLLRAFQRVVGELPMAQLTIVGDDPYERRPALEGLVDALGLSHSVTFIEARPHSEMADLYRDSDILAMSSLHESQGMVVLEAAAAGLPTVGTAVGVIPELAPDAAIAVRPRDVVALGDALIELLRDPQRLTRMGCHARQRVLEEFDAPIACREFLNVYEDAIRIARQ